MQTEYLKAIIDAMSDMVRVISREGKVALTNQSFDRKIAGNRNTVGQCCYEVFKQEDECERCLSREVMLTGKRQQFTRKYDGRVYSVTVSPLFGENENCVAAVEVFRDMTLDYNIKQNLLTQNAKMQKDLQLARNLQQALIKNVLPVIKGYELFAGFFPCEAVGGDIYDCMVYGDKMIMYVADVSGHGVMPAMLAVFFSRAVRTACSLGLALPSEIFNYVQMEFLDLNLSDAIYITGFIMMVDIEKGTYLYSNAGLSVVPILFDGEKIEEFYMSAPPICRWFDKPDFRDASGTLKDGSRILIYSDGIRDVQADERVKGRLYDFFTQKDFSCDEFVAQVRRELHTKPEDDLTMLICRKF